MKPNFEFLCEFDDAAICLWEFYISQPDLRYLASRAPGFEVYIRSPNYPIYSRLFFRYRTLYEVLATCFLDVDLPPLLTPSLLLYDPVPKFTFEVKSEYV